MLGSIHRLDSSTQTWNTPMPKADTTAGDCTRLSVMNQPGYRCSCMQAPSGYVTKTDMTHMEMSCFSLGPISKTYIIYMQILQTFFKKSKTKAFWAYALREGTLHLPLSTGTCRPLKHPWVPALFSIAVSQMRKVWFEQNNFILRGDEISAHSWLSFTKWGRHV